MGLFSSSDIGVDLGTAYSLIYVRGKGIVLRQPSVVAVERGTGKMAALGEKAKEMLGRAPDDQLVFRPLQDGVIANLDATERMLAAFFQEVVGSRIFFKPRAVIAVPSQATEVEKRAVIEASEGAGARYTYLIEEPMAAAIGAGLPVAEAAGSMVVDIGGGTAEVAVISLGDIVTSCSARVAGDSFDDAIIAYIKKKYNLLIGERTAEEIKIKIGSAYPYEGEGAIDVKGRNLVDGLPKNIEVTSEEVREALADSVNQILDAIRTTLEKTPPELAADIIDQGIMLTGGGALLRGLDRLISAETKMPVHVAENPLDCVVDGTGVCLENDMLSLTSTKNYDE